MTDFITDIEQDLVWREQELATLKALAATAPINSVRQRALLRALTAMLYAHYEGFCKFCWESYLQAISRGGVKKKELMPRFKLSALEDDIKLLRKSWSDDQILQFMEQFTRTCSEGGPVKVNINTESNLWPSRFIEIMNRLNLRSEYIVLYEVQIKALVGRRNDIAHGSKLVISDLRTYEEFENCTLLVLHELVLIMEYSLNNCIYLKPRYRRSRSREE